MITVCLKCVVWKCCRNNNINNVLPEGRYIYIFWDVFHRYDSGKKKETIRFWIPIYLCVTVFALCYRQVILCIHCIYNIWHSFFITIKNKKNMLYSVHYDCGVTQLQLSLCVTVVIWTGLTIFESQDYITYNNNNNIIIIWHYVRVRTRENDKINKKKSNLVDTVWKRSIVCVGRESLTRRTCV